MNEYKVVALNGEPAYTKEPEENCVQVIEELLERARSGEVVGIVGAVQYYDDTSTYQLGGRCGSFALLGALQVALFLLTSKAVPDE